MNRRILKPASHRVAHEFRPREEVVTKRQGDV
jgi:hypothetical protein